MHPHDTMKQCPHCGVSFPRSKKNPHIKFCSHACSVEAARIPIAYRLWSKVRKDDGCWEWKGAISKTSGYGMIAYQGKQTQPHRIAWGLTYGPIPDGLYVCHRCDNRLCVRPDHLFLGTPKENTADMIAKGRVARGERAHSSKLTADDVRAIRLSPDSAKVIAVRYGISEMYVYAIKARRTWKHI